MKQIDVLPSAFLLDSTGFASWVQIGELHLTTAAEQNLTDLQQIVDQWNTRFAAHLDFAFLGSQRGPKKNGEKW